MEKNVGSVDLDELMKARQELNNERGIETDPDMYKNYNPNRKQEEQTADDAESSSENETASMDEETAEMALDGEIPFEDNSSEDDVVPEDLQEMLGLKDEEPASKPRETEPDFSVYDNFAAFDVSGENFESESQESSAAQSEEESSAEINVENAASAGEESSNSTDFSVAGEQTTIGNFGNSKPLTEQDLNDAESLLSSSEPGLAKVSEGTQTQTAQQTDSQEESANLTSGEELQNLIDSLSVELGEEETEKLKEEHGESLETASASNVSEQAEQTAESDTANPETTMEEASDENEEEYNIDDEELERMLSLDVPEDEETTFENAETNSAEDLSEEEKLAKNATDSDLGSEQKIQEILSKLGSEKEHGGESTGYLPVIKETDFIDVVGSDVFASQDKLALVLGRNENGTFEFSTLKSLYNLAVFSNNENNSFSLVSSMMLSLMLKNSNENIDFYACDTKQMSVFDNFAKSSYLKSPVAKSQEDILSLLLKVISEIDNRYEAVATSGTKNIEDYNKAMDESYMIGFPYSILIFNNYHLAGYMENSKKINESLSYILKYGRLVGVYVYVISEEEIKEESVNYNLASRISFKVESEEESIKRVTVAGAEKLANNDDYVLKTINMENVMHIKAPNITKREIELLIENIEG